MRVKNSAAYRSRSASTCRVNSGGVVGIPSLRCGWESLMKSVTLGNVTMSHRTRGPPNALRLSHSTMIGLPRAALEISA
ncbi:hypothetical protein EVAR_75610_1 [Eumeta japonica]|uniref:Uncharacterized protein n=1 Tax=Eumeta variegata TaxID=151549 RepID=A0A4C1U0B6_EUMVA|nr:hypothetical protein EVAR_75610_1 [Eumeta japonica]